MLINLSSRYNGHFSCSRCFKLRLRDAFADKQVKAKRGKGHTESDRRFCIECGVRKKIYQPRQLIDVNEVPHYLCGLCRHMCGSGLYCIRCGGCQRCIERHYAHRISHLRNATESRHNEQKCSRCSRTYTDLGQECSDAQLLTMLQNMPLTLKMAEFQEDFGIMASPEWYEEDMAR